MQPVPLREQRDAMRACSLEWRKKKRTGDIGLAIWRDFSRQCLNRHNQGL